MRDLSSFVAGLKAEMPGDIVHHRYNPATQATFSDVPMHPRLKELLASFGVERLYSHQAEAIGLVRAGRNVVAMTPTASGKSLIYNVPILEGVLLEPSSRALYISPLKGLEQDQVSALNSMAGALALRGGAVYDGDTSQYRRRKIRENPPPVIFTNPDMLHLAINAFHPKWEGFFRNLKFVVVDEIHAYRGVFGSHVAHVMRRLRRVAARWGATPQFIACSATIANPKELAERLIGLHFEVVTESGAPCGGRHFVFINPTLESPYTEAVKLFTLCLKEGLRTIVFTKSRKITELVYYWTVQRAPHLEKLISPYRAGFLPSERRQIERALFSGELLGVVSTSALELGIDIGGLDVCILVGYPGSISSTWQRAGRVGRQGQDSLVALIGLGDALDQYLMRHPEEFFGKPIESVAIDEDNEYILKSHLPCAAAEVYLRPDDPVYDLGKIKLRIGELVAEGKLKPGREKDIWFSSERMPQRHVGIRAIGEQFAIVGEEGRIGETGGLRLLRETFPGAIYLHRGRQYKVRGIDYEAKKVFCEETDVAYYTRALTDEDAEIIDERQEKRETPIFSLCRGSMRLTYRVTGYQKRGLYDGRIYSTHALSMPPYEFVTKGVWLKIEDSLRGELDETDLGGSLHAFEHAAISAMPLFTLCDKMDIGGISYPLYWPLGQSAIFFYDGFEGGIGLTWRPFEMAEKWFSTTLRIMKECPCEEGCPSCVQDPQCGNANRPISKAGAIQLAERLLKSLQQA